jgi:hypothetical protein
MYLPSRKERKELAKKLGIKKKKETFKEMVERFGRAQEYGKMLHLQHLQNQENSRINLEKKIEEDLEDAQPTENNSEWGKDELKKIISGETPQA